MDDVPKEACIPSGRRPTRKRFAKSTCETILGGSSSSTGSIQNVSV